jgi:hypothetical protein
MKMQHYIVWAVLKEAARMPVNGVRIPKRSPRFGWCERVGGIE